MRGVFFRPRAGGDPCHAWIAITPTQCEGAMGPRLRGGDELGGGAAIVEGAGSLVSYRQASYVGFARSPERNPMQKCVGFFFVCGFLTLMAKAKML